MSDYPRQDYCGCCGRPYSGQDNDFCAECLKDHILPPRGQHPCYRTYYAQYKKDCPFEEKPKWNEPTDAL